MPEGRHTRRSWRRAGLPGSGAATVSAAVASALLISSLPHGGRAIRDLSEPFAEPFGGSGAAHTTSVPQRLHHDSPLDHEPWRSEKLLSFDRSKLLKLSPLRTAAAHLEVKTATTQLLAAARTGRTLKDAGDEEDRERRPRGSDKPPPPAPPPPPMDAIDADKLEAAFNLEVDSPVEPESPAVAPSDDAGDGTDPAPADPAAPLGDPASAQATDPLPPPPSDDPSLVPPSPADGATSDEPVSVPEAPTPEEPQAEDAAPADAPPTTTSPGSEPTIVVPSSSTNTPNGANTPNVDVLQSGETPGKARGGVNGAVVAAAVVAGVVAAIAMMVGLFMCWRRQRESRLQGRGGPPSDPDMPLQNEPWEPSPLDYEPDSPPRSHEGVHPGAPMAVAAVAAGSGSGRRSGRRLAAAASTANPLANHAVATWLDNVQASSALSDTEQLDVYDYQPSQMIEGGSRIGGSVAARDSMLSSVQSGRGQDGTFYVPISRSAQQAQNAQQVTAVTDSGMDNSAFTDNSDSAWSLATGDTVSVKLGISRKVQPPAAAGAPVTVQNPSYRTPKFQGVQPIPSLMEQYRQRMAAQRTTAAVDGCEIEAATPDRARTAVAHLQRMQM